MMHELTTNELVLLKDTFERLQDELAVLADEHGAVLNSGALEGMMDCLTIINPMYSKYLQSLEEEAIA